MIVRGNPGLGIPSSYDQPQTEKIGYANTGKPEPGDWQEDQAELTPQRLASNPGSGTEKALLNAGFSRFMVATETGELRSVSRAR